MKELNESLRRQQEELKAQMSDIKYKENVIRGLKEQMDNEHQEANTITKLKSELEIQLLEERNKFTKLEL